MLHASFSQLSHNTNAVLSPQTLTSTFCSFSLSSLDSSSGFKPEALHIPRSASHSLCLSPQQTGATVGRDKGHKAGHLGPLAGRAPAAPHLAQLLVDKLLQLRGFLRRQRHAGAGASTRIPFASGAPAGPRTSVWGEHRAGATTFLAQLPRGRDAASSPGLSVRRGRGCGGAQLSFSNGSGQPGLGAVPRSA